MKFKESKGKVFIFDGGYASGELFMIAEAGDTGFYLLHGSDVLVNCSFEIKINPNKVVYNSDIQSAVALMRIMVGEGLI